MPRPRLQNQPWMKDGEVWDSNLILRARKAFRAGATLEECKAILQSRLSNETFRQRARQQGMTWGKGSNHAGTSKLMLAPMEKL